MLKSAKIQFFKSQYNNWYCQNVIQIFLALLSSFATSSETYQYFDFSWRYLVLRTLGKNCKHLAKKQLTLGKYFDN